MKILILAAVAAFSLASSASADDPYKKDSDGDGVADSVAELIVDYLNWADAEELLEVKGIGPVLSARIIAAREARTPARFEKLSQIRAIKGIGPARLRAIVRRADLHDLD